jgi:hypothetical protein
VYEDKESVEEETKVVADRETTLDDRKNVNSADFDNSCRGGHFHVELTKLKSLERYVTDERKDQEFKTYFCLVEITGQLLPNQELKIIRKARRLVRHPSLYWMKLRRKLV